MRRFLCFLLVLVLTIGLCVSVNASTGVEGARVDAVLDLDGTCQVTLSMNLRIEQSGAIRFPVPLNARGISLNGSGASTKREGDALTVDLQRITGNSPGVYTVVLRYTVPHTVSYNEAGEPQLDLPLLSGFTYPITDLTFSVTLPEQVQFDPHFYSGYHKQSIELKMSYDKSNNQITGIFPGTLKDREILSMQLQLTKETFPRSAVEPWSAGVFDIIALVLMGLTLLYWVFFLRCAPHRRQLTLQPPPGGTAGELRCALIGRGADLTMMVLSWAQMGYILIQHKQNGRVILHKRMDMGNERGSFENKVFKVLFGKNPSIDASGVRYARLYRQVSSSKASLQDLFRKESGNPKLFRLLAAASGVFGGVSLAISLAGNALLAVLIILAMGIAGGIGSWLIQNWVEGLHLRSHNAMFIGFGSCLLWLFLGILGNAIGMTIGIIVFQLLVGLAGSYGGRRTPSGRAITAQILGLRASLRKMPEEELERVRHNQPDQFFDMLPYAMALGVDKQYAAQFGRQKLIPCPWLTTGRDGQKTATEWAHIVRRTAAAMDEHQKRLAMERLFNR